MKLLFKSVTVIAPESPFHQKTTDLLLEAGKIVKIGGCEEIAADRVIEQNQLHVSPGWFDSSVSFGEPGYEERETLENGLCTAAKSGFTSLALNPDMKPVPDQNSTIDFLIRKSADAPVNLYPIGALTQGSKGEELAEMYDMHLAGAVAFGDYKKPIYNPNLLKIALQYARGFGGVIQTFPNENRLTGNGVMNEGVMSTQLGLKGIPDFAEEMQVARDLAVLEYAGGKLHIPTISTAKSAQLIEEAKEKGLDVSCSVAVPHLFFNDTQLQGFDASYKVMPPLRTESNREALLAAIEKGVVDMVTTDHRPMNIEHKKLEFEQADYGSLGLESAFGALNKLFGLEKTIDLLTAGRERFGLKKPLLKEGEKAELSLFIPSGTHAFSERDIYSTSKNSMFLGAELKGKPMGVFANNRLSLTEDE